jgi:hypothetical protein
LPSRLRQIELTCPCLALRATQFQHFGALHSPGCQSRDLTSPQKVMHSPFSLSRAAAGVLLENFIRSASERPFHVNRENLVVQRESERRDGPKLLGRTDWGGNLWGQPSVPAVQLMGGAVRALSSRRQGRSECSPGRGLRCYRCDTGLQNRRADDGAACRDRLSVVGPRNW